MFGLCVWKSASIGFTYDDANVFLCTLDKNWLLCDLALKNGLLIDRFKMNSTKLALHIKSYSHCDSQDS